MNNVLRKLTLQSLKTTHLNLFIACLIIHAEVLHHQKHDSHPILAHYGADQFSTRNKDKGYDIIFKSLESFSFKPITTFQTKLLEKS